MTAAQISGIWGHLGLIGWGGGVGVAQVGEWEVAGDFILVTVVSCGQSFNDNYTAATPKT